MTDDCNNSSCNYAKLWNYGAGTRLPILAPLGISPVPLLDPPGCETLAQQPPLFDISYPGPNPNQGVVLPPEFPGYALLNEMKCPPKPRCPLAPCTSGTENSCPHGSSCHISKFSQPGSSGYVFLNYVVQVFIIIAHQTHTVLLIEEISPVQ